MTRGRLDYSARQERVVATGFDADVPTPGFYRMRFVTGGVFVGVRIWFGPPHDPDTGEEMDRSHRWQAEANGSPIAVERVWPRCARDPVGPTEYAYLTSRQDWARTAQPDSSLADPSRRLDPLTSPILI